MRAAHGDREPQQLAFIDPAPAPAPMRLAIGGTLRRHAEVRHSVDGRAHLFVEVQQPHGLPCIAMLHADRDDVIDLEHLAARLLPGAHVLLRGAGLVVTHHHGADALELKHCDSVSELAVAPPAPEH